MTATSARAVAAPHPGLGLLGAIAVSLSIVSPTLAISLNPQAIGEEVGGAIPVVYLLALVPILLIAAGFALLAARYGSVGSVVGLLHRTVGDRASSISGFVLAGAYVMALPGTMCAFALFVQALAVRLLGWEPADAPMLLAGVGVLLVGYLIALRPLRLVGNVLLSIEGLSVVVITLVALAAMGAMLMGRGTPEQQVTFSDFSLAGVSFSTIGIALTFAVVSVAGFEGAASVGESTRNPRRNVPLALIATAVGAVLFYTLVSAVGVWAFSTSVGDVESGSMNASLPSALADAFVGPFVGTFLLLTGALTCLAGVIGACVGASRIVAALSGRGLLPGRLTHRDAATGEPDRAMRAVALTGLLVTLVCILLVGTDLFRVFELAGAVAGFLFLAVYAAVCTVAARVMWAEGRPLGVALMVMGTATAVVIFGVTLFPLPDGWARWGPVLAVTVLVAAVVLGVRGDRAAGSGGEDPTTL